MGNGRGERALGGGGEGEEEARAWWRVAPCAAGCMRRWGLARAMPTCLLKRLSQMCEVWLVAFAEPGDVQTAVAHMAFPPHSDQRVRARTDSRSMS